MTADSMPIVFDTFAFQRYESSFGGSASVWVNPTGNVRSPTYQTDPGKPTGLWALVLDRKDPTKPALFNGALSSNTDVPANLASLMNPNSLFFFMGSTYSTGMPQGALYTMLQENGAGAELQKIERLAYYNGCGMSWGFLYNLVSVPGTGLPGIEKSTPRMSASSTSPANVYSSVAIQFQTLLSMIPGPQGYTPTEIG